ncbi:energy-coupling factor ABC transporter ATP-binding protein [Agrococcus sp. HG114]|uniref:energy-coupling factor ABC transporter ATP-binding protein n=1 Tax=Agrococcus sp. HG114 TaxID=2969757 RepID=UPI00215B01DD|nr:ABC transporter ATP-binding protein [Agrococcus sp. HG114]
MTLENVSFAYEGAEEAKVLQGIDLDIRPGEFVSIIGANGSGKTTLCNAIRGFAPKFFKGEFAGRVLINGRDIADEEIGELAKEIGFVFQNPFTQMSGTARTVYDELAFGLGNLGLPRDEIIARVDEMVQLARLQDLVDRNPFQLSGGQQQRVALSSILVMAQDILVIDEPTSQLDPQSTDDVFELIERMKGQGRTIVLVEHKMEHVAAFSDRVVLMDAGRIVDVGTPREIFANPRTAAIGTRLPQALTIARQLEQVGIRFEVSPLTTDELVGQLEPRMVR